MSYSEFSYISADQFLCFLIVISSRFNIKSCYLLITAACRNCICYILKYVVKNDSKNIYRYELSWSKWRALNHVCVVVKWYKDFTITDYLIVETTDGDARVDVRARRQCPETDVGGWHAGHGSSWQCPEADVRGCPEPDPPGGHAEHKSQTDVGHG